MPMPPYGVKKMRKPTTIFYLLSFVFKSSLLALGLTGRTVPVYGQKGPPDAPDVPTTAWTKGAGGLTRACALRGLLVITSLWLLWLPSSPAYAGTVWAWGYNQFGQLGNNSIANTAFPVQVRGPGGIGVLSGITAIAAGARHSLAGDSTGAAWAWGFNNQGQLGDGTFTDRHVPVRVVGLIGVIAVAGGINYSLALKSDGTVWAWGNNAAGQLGNGTTDPNHPSLRPVQVKGPGGAGVLSGITAIAAGTEHSLALRGADGAVFAWGANNAGQLGNGTSGPGANTNLPVRVLTRLGTCCLAGIKAITAGGDHSLARKSNGLVLAWGDDGRGQLGDGNNNTISTIPVFVLGLGATTAIGAGDRHSLAAESDGTAWAWGLGGQGELGDGDNQYRDASAPVQVLGVGRSGVLTGIIGIKGGLLHSLARRSDGTLFAWGFGAQGQLGNGRTFGSNVPVQVINLTGMTQIAAGSHHSLALKP
jgi:alpha-tubulin suppressor-like RCC1 family protein